jgi:hypothetical protein
MALCSIRSGGTDGLWAGSLPGDFAAELAELVGSTVFVRHTQKAMTMSRAGETYSP